jgi:hypothetical protein
VLWAGGQICPTRRVIAIGALAIRICRAHQRRCGNTDGCTNQGTLNFVVRDRSPDGRAAKRPDSGILAFGLATRKPKGQERDYHHKSVHVGLFEIKVGRVV